MKWLYAVLAVLGFGQAVTAVEPPPSPLPRICRDDDPAMLCMSPFVVLRATPDTIYLNGDIWDEAPANFLRILRLTPEARRLVLYSHGGYIDPALLLAREVHKRGLATEIEPGGFCYSSCAYVFFAGRERRVAGELGVHQVYTADRDGVQAQQGFADVFDAMKEYGVADRIISLMLSTPPNGMHVFSKAEIAALGVETAAGRSAAEQNEDRLPAEGGERTTLSVVDEPSLNPEGSQALLLEASDDGRTGAIPFSGSVEWQTGKDEMGAPTILALATIPARNLGVRLLFRKNYDNSLPTPMLIEVNFKLSDNFIGGSVAGIPGILLKDEELVQGVPLIGASVRVIGNEFLFAASSADEDHAENSKLLATRKWIDLAVIYATGKRAIVTLEKDEAAQRQFKDTLAAWRQP